MISKSWIPVDKLAPFIQLEGYVILWVLLPLGFIFYKIFLKNITPKRHENLRQRFFQTFIYLVISTILSGLFWWIFSDETMGDGGVSKLVPYLGLSALFFGSVAVIKTAQNTVYLYLFLVNMGVGVPRLIANLFTFLFSSLLIGFLSSEIFGFQIATLLATSAIFSLVLGLALQDTLGNLLSGLALQIDKPFSIGDWLEVHSSSDKWTGRVQEINWRGTYLLSFSDELILIPNRTMAQSQILIYSNQLSSVRHSHTFRFSYKINVPETKNIILQSLKNIEEILLDPEPRVLIIEITESWVTMKVFYSIKDFSTKYRTGDKVLTHILSELERHQIELAHTKIKIMS